MVSCSTILALLGHAAQIKPEKGLIFVQGGTETKTTYSQLWKAAQVSRWRVIALTLFRLKD